MAGVQSHITWVTSLGGVTRRTASVSSDFYLAITEREVF